MHLDDNQKAIFGRDENLLPGVELVSGLQLWLPMIGILCSVFVYQSTVDTMIQLNIPDLALASLYTGSGMFLFYVPAALLGCASTEYATQFVSATPSSKSGRRQDESFWRWVVGAGFLMTGAGFISLVGLPLLVGVPFGLALLHQRFGYRAKHLEKCAQARRVALQFPEGGAESGTTARSCP
ncbi:MAG: hypothetical protein GY719_36900 [bacterium]|nr:hypothetical protein [bacterium]